MVIQGDSPDGGTAKAQSGLGWDPTVIGTFAAPPLIPLPFPLPLCGVARTGDGPKSSPSARSPVSLGVLPLPETSLLTVASSPSAMPRSTGRRAARTWTNRWSGWTKDSSPRGSPSLVSLETSGNPGLVLPLTRWSDAASPPDGQASCRLPGGRHAELALLLVQLSCSDQPRLLGWVHSVGDVERVGPAPLQCTSPMPLDGTCSHGHPESDLGVRKVAWVGPGPPRPYARPTAPG